ncbi:MAG: hypothetical protein PUC85_06995 [bacterium]|nr:hypothetical protein [bacterium]
MYLSLLVDEETARRIMDGQRVVGAIYHCGNNTAYLRPYATSRRKQRGTYSRSAHGCVRLNKKELQVKIRIKRDERLCDGLGMELRDELWDLQNKANRLIADEQGEQPTDDEGKEVKNGQE